MVSPPAALTAGLERHIGGSLHELVLDVVEQLRPPVVNALEQLRRRRALLFADHAGALQQRLQVGGKSRLGVSVDHRDLFAG